jgi:hypothetical protein
MRKLTLVLRLSCILSLAFGRVSALHDRGTISARGPAAEASLAVCAQPAKMTAVPCSPLETSATGTTSGVNLLTAAALRKFHFNAPPGLHTIQLHGSQIGLASVTTDISLGSSSGLKNSWTGILESGRGWYDVGAYGAKGDGSSDDTASIQAAVGAACATTPPGGTIYFPPSRPRYSISGTIQIACSGVNFEGATWEPADFPDPFLPPAFISCPTCNVPMFAGDNLAGIQFHNLGLAGGSATNENSQGISLGTIVNQAIVDRVFFDQMGSSAVVTSGGTGLILTYDFAQNCVAAHPNVDTGCFDLASSDTYAAYNFASGTPTVSGNIGNGHSYGVIIRATSGNGFFFGNAFDQNQHGWLIAGQFQTLIGNRSYQPQGNCFVISGGGNILTGNKCLDGSLTANGAFSGFKVSSNQNIFSDNICDTDGTGILLNCIDDSNSNGAADSSGNRYSNNRAAAAAITGVLYNMTGSSPYRIAHPTRNSTQTTTTGAMTLTAALDGEVQYFNTAMTGNVTVMMSPRGAWNGARFRIVRGPRATGRFGLTACGKVLGAANTWVDCEFLGGAWTEVASGRL